MEVAFNSLVRTLLPVVLSLFRIPVFSRFLSDVLLRYRFGPCFAVMKIYSHMAMYVDVFYLCLWHALCIARIDYWTGRIPNRTRWIEYRTTYWTAESLGRS